MECATGAAGSWLWLWHAALSGTGSCSAVRAMYVTSHRICVVAIILVIGTGLSSIASLRCLCRINQGVRGLGGCARAAWSYCGLLTTGNCTFPSTGICLAVVWCGRRVTSGSIFAPQVPLSSERKRQVHLAFCGPYSPLRCTWRCQVHLGGA
jgi:hypothetical protein